MIGTKLYKDNPNDMDKYSDVAVWCNANNATIEDKGDYYEVVEITPYVPTKEEKIEQLSNDYQKARFTIGTYYMEAVLDGNVEVQKDLQVELTELKEQFESDVAAIMSEEE